MADDGTHGIEPWLLEHSDQIEGDIDGNGEIEFADFLLFVQHFGTSANRETTSSDLNKDGQMNFADFLRFSIKFDAESRAATTNVTSSRSA